MNEDFFSKIDKKLSELETSRVAKADAKQANEEFSAQALAEMLPVAQRYAEELKARGMTAKVSGNERGLSFDMVWADGTRHGLNVSTSENGRLEMQRHSTDHTDMRRFRSTDGITYDEALWEPVRFTNALEAVINDYLFYADKHGGVA